jgi:hypothetical protein
MSKTLVITPEGSQVYIYCHRCRKGEPNLTRRPGWRTIKKARIDSLDEDLCPDCPAEVVGITAHTEPRIVCAVCDKHIAVGKPVILLDKSQVVLENGSACYTENRPQMLCSHRCARAALAARR